MVISNPFRVSTSIHHEILTDLLIPTPTQSNGTTTITLLKSFFDICDQVGLILSSLFLLIGISLSQFAFLEGFHKSFAKSLLLKSSIIAAQPSFTGAFKTAGSKGRRTVKSFNLLTRLRGT